jgi:hypothetical protein
LFRRKQKYIITINPTYPYGPTTDKWRWEISTHGHPLVYGFSRIEAEALSDVQDTIEHLRDFYSKQLTITDQIIRRRERSANTKRFTVKI